MVTPFFERVLRYSWVFLAFACACSSTTEEEGAATAPPPDGSSGPDGTPAEASADKARCAALLRCCDGYPPAEQGQCRATATDPNESDFQCDQQIITATANGYCNLDGDPTVVDAGENDAGSGDAGSVAVSDAGCSALPMQACVQCCTDAHPLCKTAVEAALAQCACTSDECLGPCGATFCADAGDLPMTGSCASCLQQVESGDCENQLLTAYASTPDCGGATICQNGCTP